MASGQWGRRCRHTLTDAQSTVHFSLLTQAAFVGADAHPETKPVPRMRHCGPGPSSGGTFVAQCIATSAGLQHGKQQVQPRL